MSIDKDFCCSSFLAFRYIERKDVDFFESLHHRNYTPIPDEEKVKVKSAEDIDETLKRIFDNYKNEELGIMLSGGMDSAILASYMSGSHAYTFRYLGGNYQKEELRRAELYADIYRLNLHYVDISWDDVQKYLPIVMKVKNAPVHSIEPQIYKAAIQAQYDGVKRVVVGESSDLVFGGMDQLLSKDWSFEEFVNRYVFVDPESVLVNPKDMRYLFERYRKNVGIDYLSFMDDVFSIESSGSYLNAFTAAGIQYIDPYGKMKMADPLDLERIRRGESKYLIRELFKQKYPMLPVPEKIPMPRPVDVYFENWEGPRRKEFIQGLDMKKFTGNQKWLLYCLEEFLNLFDPG